MSIDLLCNDGLASSKFQNEDGFVSFNVGLMVEIEANKETSVFYLNLMMFVVMNWWRCYQIIVINSQCLNFCFYFILLITRIICIKKIRKNHNFYRQTLTTPEKRTFYFQDYQVSRLSNFKTIKFQDSRKKLSTKSSNKKSHSYVSLFNKSKRKVSRLLITLKLKSRPYILLRAQKNTSPSFTQE